MAFVKGREKTGGRKTGSLNRASLDIKSKIATLLDYKFDSIQADFEALEPKDRVAVYLKFIEYIVPKQREQKIDLSTLTDEQVDDILDKAMAKLSQ